MAEGTRRRTRRGIYLALVALGGFTQVSQALLGRELLVVFHGNEISLGAFYGAWLMWIGLGAVLAAALRRRLRDPLAWFARCLLSLPALLAVEVAAASAIRALVGVPAVELVPLGKLMVAAALVTMPLCLVAGAAFPLGCKALAAARRRGREGEDEVAADSEDVANLYILEAAGALLGGVLFTFVFISWLTPTTMVAAAALMLVAGVLVLGLRSKRGLVAAALVGGLGLAMLLSPLGGWLHARAEAARFASLHPGLELVDSVNTRYGHVAVARRDEQISIAFDGRIAVSFPEPRGVAEQAAYLYSQAAGARRVLLLGGVASGLAAELLRYPIAHLDVVEDDERAFARVRGFLDQGSQRALEDPRLSLHFGDGRRFVRAQGRGYDLVLVLTPDPASAHLNRYFTREFYASARAAMADDGVLCTSVTSAANYMGSAVASYSGSIYRTLGAVFTEVVVTPGDVHSFCAAVGPGRVTGDAAALAQRYRATSIIGGRTVPESYFADLLEAERVAQVAAGLAGEEGGVNSDLAPVTYYLNMILWAELSASSMVDLMTRLRDMGIWTWLLPLFVVVGLLLGRAAIEGHARARRRRASALIAISVLGFVAMAVQMQLLLSYQAQVGMVFSRIALLNGVFMTGLALGAGIIGRRLAGSVRPGLALLALLAVIAAGCVLMPAALGALAGLGEFGLEVAYVGMVAVAGTLTGSGFPIAVKLAHSHDPDLLRTSATVEAADHLGGAVGGVLAGGFLIPILGVARTSYLLAIALVVAASAVAAAELARGHGARAAGRGYASFPFTRTSWGLAMVVISVFALVQLARASAPGPRVDFDEATLADVSGSESFLRHDEPMPYYLGTSSDSAERTVALASLPVAGDVRGYAGPLNLLVAVDDQGVLRGVRYIDSDETPAYIAEIDAWLAALAGHDLGAGPLAAAAVDAMSGATISSEAALRSIDRAAQLGARHGLDVIVAGAEGGAEASFVEVFLTVRVGVTLGLFLLFLFVLASGRDDYRFLYQVAVVVVFGVLFNSLLTEIDLFNLSQARLPSWQSNPSFYLVVGFVLVTSLLWGQVYCGYVCPFGALQELVSRLGRRLSLRSYAHQWIELRVRYARLVVAALAFSAAWVSNEQRWIAFNPMQRFFSFDFSGWITWLVITSLVGALFYYRFWCRYFCPAGALLALGNKLALLGRGSPRRNFRRCDLAARAEFDINCIRCHRCVSGNDIGIRKTPAPL